MADPENTVASRAHRDTLKSSEGTRQVAVATALSTFKSGGAYATYAAAVKAEDIAHHRRVLASAKTNAVTIPVPSIAALQELGTGGA